jgi:hypothetical protein
MRFLVVLPSALAVPVAVMAGVIGLHPVGFAPVAGHVGGRAAAAPRADLAEALGVLRGWDTRRARAWAGEDVAALRALYLPGAGAGRADVRLLRAYRARGLVVRRLETQVLAAWVLHRDSRSLRLRVVDRVAGGELRARTGGRDSPLASTVPAARTVVFRRTPNGWRVARVSGSG